MEARKRSLRTWYGQTVKICIDRPLGSRHQKYPDLIYGVNYGFLEDVMGGDGEGQDVYLLGVDKPVNEYTAVVIGGVFRLNDIEDKLIAVPLGKKYTKEEVSSMIDFQERYYLTEIEMIE